MNSLLDSILRSKSLEESINMLKQDLKLKESELEKMQSTCTHGIVIVSEIVSQGHSIKAQCLFCGKSFSTPHELRELPNRESVLGAYSFRQFKNVSSETIYESVTEKAKIILKNNRNLSEKQLLEHLTKLLQKEEEDIFARMFKNNL